MSEQQARPQIATSESAAPRTEAPSGHSQAGPQLPFAATGMVALALFVATYVFFVTTEPGQRIENLALRGAELRDGGDRQAALDVLSLATTALFVLVLAGVFIAGLVLRHPGLGTLAVAIMVLSVAAAEFSKDLLGRPALVSGPEWILRNSYPSGTATAATAMAVGVLLVVPNRLRWLVLPAGATFAALVGYSVQASGWHRLSDTIGASVLVIGVAAIGVTMMARAGLVHRSEGGRIDWRVGRSLAVAAAGLLLLAVVLLALPAAFPLLTIPEGARRAFLQTAFPLVGAAVTVVLLTVFGLLVEPFALGHGRERPHEPEFRHPRSAAHVQQRQGGAREPGDAGARQDTTYGEGISAEREARDQQ